MVTDLKVLNDAIRKLVYARNEPGLLLVIHAKKHLGYAPGEGIR